MILYTVVNELDIFADSRKSSGKDCLYKNIKGGFLEMRRGANGYRIARLHSTNPADYLNSKYYPY